MKRRILLLAAAGLAFALHMQGASADDMGTAISDLGHAWAKVYYQTPEKQQETQYPALIAQARNARLLAIAGSDLDVSPYMRRNVYGDMVRPYRTDDDRYVVGSVVDSAGLDDLLFAVVWDPITDDIELCPVDNPI